MTLSAEITLRNPLGCGWYYLCCPYPGSVLETTSINFFCKDLSNFDYYYYATENEYSSQPGSGAGCFQ
eukprot:1158794-Pelagomonas_calceolata.AAC.1